MEIMSEKKNTKTCFICSIAFLSLGFINGLTNLISYKEQKYVTLFAALPNIGIFLGLLVQIYKKINTKYCVIISTFIHSICFMLQLFLNDTLVLVLRFILGFSASFFLICCTNYIESFATNKNRDFFNTFSASCFSIGLLISESLNLLFSTKEFIVLSFYSFFFLILFYSSFSLPRLKNKKNNLKVKELIYFSFLLLIQQFTFAGNILAFSKKVFQSKINNLPLLLAFINLISNFFSIFLVKFINPLIIYKISLFFSFGSLFLLFLGRQKDVLLFVLIFFYSLGIGPLTWTIISNFMDYEIKNMVYLAGNIVNFLNAFVISYFYGLFLGSKNENNIYLLGSIVIIVTFFLFYSLRRNKINKIFY